MARCAAVAVVAAAVARVSGEPARCADWSRLAPVEVTAGDAWALEGGRRLDPTLRIRCDAASPLCPKKGAPPTRCTNLLHTRKYDKTCQGPGEAYAIPRTTWELGEGTIPLLLTGACGAGNHATLHWLAERLGGATHEDFGVPITISWQHAVSDWAAIRAYPHKQRYHKIYPPLAPRFAKVVHVVRCPLDTLATLLSHGPKTMGFLEAVGIPAPIDRGADEMLAWGTRHYLAWNAHVASYADWRFRVEDAACEDAASCATAEKIAAKIADLAGLRPSPRIAPGAAIRAKTHGLSLESLARSLGSAAYVRDTCGDAPAVLAALVKTAKSHGYDDRCLIPDDKARDRFLWRPNTVNRRPAEDRFLDDNW